MSTATWIDLVPLIIGVIFISPFTIWGVHSEL